MLKFEYNGGWDTGYTGYYYIHTYPDPKNVGRLAKARGIHSCREYFIQSYRREINKGSGFTPHALKAYALISYGRPGGPISAYKERQANLMSDAVKGLFIINSFEKAHKWPLTKLYPVEHTGHGNITFAFFKGPRKWTTSPYLMSIWSFAMRLGKNSWLPKNIEKFDHEELVKKLRSKAKTNARCSDDAIQIFATINQWDTFISLYKDLFGGQTRKHHWEMRHLQGHNDRPEGIRMLLDGTTGYKSLHKLYHKLKEEKKTK